MTIEEAKSDLEKQIIFLDGVIGIGVITENDLSVIEVAIEKNDTKIALRLNELIKDGQWKGYKTIIVPADGFDLN